MADKDLGEELENIEEGIENLKNKEFKLLGMKMTPMTIGAAITALGSLIGMLYGGFVMYQKVEAIAEIEPDAIFAELEKIGTRIDEQEKDADGMKSDIKRAEDTADSAYRYVKDVNKDVNDELRAFRKDIKELETNLEDKIQKALDNPLAN